MILSDRRQQIIEIATSMAQIHGWSYVSMRKISAKIGVSVPIIYKIFSSKEELLAEVCKITFSELISRLDFIQVNSIEPVRDATNEIYEFFCNNIYVFDFVFKKTSFETVVYKSSILKALNNLYKSTLIEDYQTQAAITLASLIGQIMLKKEFKKLSHEKFVTY
jgi:AcrR family transcriptional regulator